MSHANINCPDNHIYLQANPVSSRYEQNDGFSELLNIMQLFPQIQMKAEDEDEQEACRQIHSSIQ
jgi:hypothetical protein